MNIINNPFNFLDVSQRDKVAKIIDQAEVKSLFEDQLACDDAKNILTNPINRVKAEINWLPGVSPTKIKKIVQYIEEIRDLSEVVYEVEDIFEGCLPIVYMNIEKTILEEKSAICKDDIFALIHDMAELYERIDNYDLLEMINNSRKLCGIACVNSVDIIDNELENYKSECINTFMGVIDTLSAADIVDLVTELIDTATDSGENYAPELINCVVDGYEVRTKGIIERKEEALYRNIYEILALDLCELSESAVCNVIDKYISDLKGWDKFAQPIQLRSMSKGEKYESADLGEASRKIAVALFNNGYEDKAEEFLSELNGIFTEVGSVVELIKRDEAVISDIKHQREEEEIRAKRNYEKWLKDIACDEIVGTIFKSHIIINENGICVDDGTIKLEDVTAIKFGSRSQTVVSKTLFSRTEQTFTAYNFGIMSATNELTVKFRDATSGYASNYIKNSQFEKIKNSLLSAVGNKIISNMLTLLKQGRSIKIGEITVHNDYVILPKKHFFASDEYVKCGWDDVDFELDNGSLIVKSKYNNIECSMELSGTYNAYLFYIAVQMFNESDALRIGDTLG